jgi:uncharacterized protein (TIGR00725 family)
MEQRYVGVVGSSSPDDGEACDLAEEVGRLLAERRAVVVCGGLTGVMEHVCRGARQAGGTTVGLLPGDTRAEANDFLTIALPTGLGQIRNALIVRASDAVIAIGGGWGTLSEIALAVRTGVPVFGLRTWDTVSDGIRVVNSPEEAVRGALGPR